MKYNEEEEVDREENGEEEDKENKKRKKNNQLHHQQQLWLPLLSCAANTLQCVNMLDEEAARPQMTLLIPAASQSVSEAAG